MVGSRGDVPNESEVFLPDLLHCTVLEETTDGTYLGKTQEIQARVFTDTDQLRHEESMHMAEKQYTAQTNSVLIQQQMLANQQAQAAQPASVQTLAQAEQTQPSE